MYKTKKEVDAHVRASLARAGTEKERKKLGLVISKLYFKINEYSLAIQYLGSYLSIKNDDSQAHKLLGQCYQHLRKPDKALQSYQVSLQLNSKQPDIIIEVCKLLLEDNNLNVKKAKYWCDLAESQKINNEAVFSLRLQLLNKNNVPTNEVEELLQKEINERPNDVQLRVRLVRVYVEQNKVVDAFKYVYELEMTFNDALSNSHEWYNIVWLVLSKYERMQASKKDWDFWLLLTICLERQVQLSFSQIPSIGGNSCTEIANLLFNFDQYLFKITQLSDKLSAHKELVAVFLDHYRGQLLLHAAALMFKREEMQNKNRWKDIMKHALPILLLAFQTVPPENQDQWTKYCDENGKKLIQLWNREGAFRCAQAGRTILACINENGTNKENDLHHVNNLLEDNAQLWNSSGELLEQIRIQCSNKQWRQNLFLLLFLNVDQKVKDQTSALVKSEEFLEPMFEIPAYMAMERYEDMAQYLQPYSLQHMVYISFAVDNLAYVQAKFFNGLNFSSSNLAFCGAESLNQLDVETFLYATTLQAKRLLETGEKEGILGKRINAGRPSVLPFANVSAYLCTDEQAEWWTTAYQVYQNLGKSNLGEMRRTLQYGIEAVRGVNGPKVDMMIVFKIGNILVSRAHDVCKQSEKEFLEVRAETLYKYGLNMLKMHNKGVLEPFRKYFKYAQSNTSSVEREVAAAAEDAVSFLAARYFKKSHYEELIDELTGVQLPYATYLQAEAYRKLDETSKTPLKAKRKYLDRASECLNQTLVLLKSTQTDPNHPLNSVIHSELKRLRQASTALSNDNYNFSAYGHNNSSTYEDAETDFFAEPSGLGTPNVSRSRREAAATAAAILNSSHTLEIENLVKHMAKTLSFVRDEIVDSIKPELHSMRQEMTTEISTLKEKIAGLEEAMKRTRISSNPPSRDDASHVLDELYMLDDALQNQLYTQSASTQQQHLSTPNNIFPNTLNAPPGAAVHSPFATHQQQPRIQTPNALQIQQNAAAVAAAAAYGSPMFNPNYAMTYYTPPPYMMQQSASAPNSALLGQRGPLSMPYMDTGNVNFNMASTTPLLPPPSQDTRSSNLYCLLTQQQQAAGAQMPQLSTPISLASLAPVFATATSGSGAPVTTATSVSAAPAVAAAVAPTNVVQFNKMLNNQPVERGPPANVVITSSDPLPNPNTAPLQAQQPTLSVTIPSHHIKPSIVHTPDAVTPVTIQPSLPHIGAISSTTSFNGLNLSKSLSGVGGTSGQSANTNNTPTSSSSVSIFPISGNSIKEKDSLSSFSFKSQVAEALRSNAAATAAAESPDSRAENLNVSGDHNRSEPEVEYDPCPDFKPIIPLPDEVEVKTGEEDEEVLFSYRAKLYRHMDKEWKERGLGEVKILKDKEGHSRLLMRREQTFKICANHKITKELKLASPKNEMRSFCWVANDYADEELKLEKFLIRFKLEETAQKFAKVFKQAQEDDAKLEAQNNNVVSTSSNSVKPGASKADTKAQSTDKNPATVTFNLAKSNVKNFATSTPAAKGDSVGLLPKPSTSQQAIFTSTAASNSTTPNNTTTTTAKSLFGGGVFNFSQNGKSDAPKVAASATPFSSFSFGKDISVPTSTTASPYANLFTKSTPNPFTLSSFQSPIVPKETNTENAGIVADSNSNLNKSTASDNEDEYVPTATFNPAIPLPDLVEVSTGEENELVLFEHRAKLLRFDKTTVEWKERGLGTMKVLQDANDVNKVRLVMRREQVHKLCCNQRLQKETVFKFAKNSTTALTWAGQDYSEGELTTETLTVRFKSPDTCKLFLDTILKAQNAMTTGTKAELTGVNASKSKEDTTEKDLKKEASVKGFGDAFKPKVGNWDCQNCYVSNAGKDLYCAACNAPKDDTVPKKQQELSVKESSSKFQFGFNPTGSNTSTSDTPVSTSAQTIFSFTNFPTSTASTTSISTNAKPTATTTSAASSTKALGFGDKFKPKPGSWQCNGCYLANNSDASYCSACDAPKDPSMPKKETPNANILAPSNPTQKFTFGFATGTSSNATTATTTTSTTSKTSSAPFTFGAPTSSQSDPAKSAFGSLANTTDAAKSFTFTPPSATSTTLNASLAKPLFSFSMQPANLGGSGESGSIFSLDRKDFSFTMKPKSPGKANKSPVKLGGGGDADEDVGDDGEYQEEENNTYFAPVIPLPDKVEVKTGEEGEDLLYVHRAKLYRFTDGEWKERGVGAVKILRHKETGKLRVVMRRDQVLKICLNHVLNAEVDYKPKDDKSWLFVANDFSEGEVDVQKFSLRFKSKEIADSFMEAVKNALTGTVVALDPNSPLPNVTNNVSDEDKKKAEKLFLPPDFYSSKMPCAGCAGCDSESFIYPVIKSVEQFVDEGEPLPLQLPELDCADVNTSLLKKSAFSSPSTVNDAAKTGAGPFSSSSVSNEQSFGVDLNKIKPVNATFSFASPLNSKKPEEPFSFAAAIKNEKPAETKSDSGKFLFGSATSGGSIFSGGDGKLSFGQTGASVFGGTSTNTTPTAGHSIFGQTFNSTVSGGSSVFGSNIFSESSKVSLFDNSNSSAKDNPTPTKTETEAKDLSTKAKNVESGDTKANAENSSTLFAGIVGKDSKEPQTGVTFADFSSKASGVDFATLAKNATATQSAFSGKPGPGGFFGLTNQDAFSSFAKTPNNDIGSKVNSSQTEVADGNVSQQSNTEEGEGHDNADNYDPYYEPVISLPNEVVVTTGEEEETKLFGDRGTLYRYDISTKEWKERGVGEVKILFHPAKGMYRIVLRREQVHKVVLNQPVGVGFSFTNMNNNPKSFIWAGLNYAESDTGELEKLAVRFKKVDVAEQFAKQLNSCIEASKKKEESQEN